tara:strand:- start:18 stop:1142 length:1125 start_codon:yes stop_codon:yes gene_type:complete
MFIAASSTGKNAAMDAGKRFFPPTAYEEISAGSERSFIYSKASFEHKILIMSEFDSWPTDGAPAAAMRAVITDSRCIYDTVVTSSDGPPEQFRLIKKGPTGLMSSTTGSLNQQESTRMLQVSLTGSAEQTKLVHKLIAQKAAGKRTPIDYAEYVAMNRWIALEQKKNGYSEPIIPYAEKLTELLWDKYGFAKQERSRRDLDQVMTCIKAVALMHIKQRELDGEGRIISTPDDYGMASEVLGHVIETTQEEGLSKNTRALVNAIKELESEGMQQISQTDLAKHLDIKKGTASKWCKEAVESGYIVNADAQSGTANEYQLGEAIPEGDSFPTLEELEAAIQEGLSINKIRNEQQVNSLGNTKTGVKQEPFTLFPKS